MLLRTRDILFSRKHKNWKIAAVYDSILGQFQTFRSQIGHRIVFFQIGKGSIEVDISTRVEKIE